MRISATRARVPAGHREHLVSDPHVARGDRPLIATELALLEARAGLRVAARHAHHALHRKAQRLAETIVAGIVVPGRHGLQVLQQGRAGVPAQGIATLHQHVAAQGREGNLAYFGEAQSRGEAVELRANRLERLTRAVHQVHLVDRQHDARNAHPPRQVGMPAGLLLQPVAHVHQQHCDVGSARRCHHVARVLGMPGRVADDELACGRREVAVSDVDRDALLALGQQPVGQQGQVDGREPAPPGGRLERGDLIRQQSLAVVEQAADQGALAVVDAAGGDEAQQPGVARRIP